MLNIGLFSNILGSIAESIVITDPNIMTVLRLLTGRKAALRILVINQIIVMICIAMIMVSIVNGCSIIIKWGFLNIILTHCQIITRI